MYSLTYSNDRFHKQFIYDIYLFNYLLKSIKQFLFYTFYKIFLNLFLIFALI